MSSSEDSALGQLESAPLAPHGTWWDPHVNFHSEVGVAALVFSCWKLLEEAEWRPGGHGHQTGEASPALALCSGHLSLFSADLMSKARRPSLELREKEFQQARENPVVGTGWGQKCTHCPLGTSRNECRMLGEFLGPQEVTEES